MPAKPLVQQFYRTRLEAAIRDIQNTKLAEGVRVWKLYNHGFIVRSPSVAFAFDIVTERPSGFAIAPDALAALADQVDALFISHYHPDHANQKVARMFVARNKPVVAPEELWKEVPDLQSRLRHPKRTWDAAHVFPIQDGKQKLVVYALPGHQNNPASNNTILNNVHLVTTPERITLMQTGDQFDSEEPGADFDWLAQISRDHDVDVLLPNCWTNSIGRLIRAVDPALVITGHENELGHTVDHREDHTLTYGHLFGTATPCVVMGRGESYHYRREPARDQKKRTE